MTYVVVRLPTRFSGIPGNLRSVSGSTGLGHMRELTRSE